MSEISKQYFQAKRRFEDSNFVYALYAIWVLVIFVIFVFFGIKPTYENILEKKQMIVELTKANKNLYGNIVLMDKLRNGVLSDQTLLDRLDSAMPTAYDVDGFILQFENAVSASGFILVRVNAQPAIDPAIGGLTITARVKGPGKFPLLIENMERLKRTTRLDTYDYRVDTHSSVQGDATVDLSFYIFNYGITK